MGWRLTFLAAVAIVAIAGVAVAAQGGGSGDVTICAEKHGGDLSLAAKGKCGKGEKKLVIAKKGPQGIPGQAGTAGAAGAAGTTASIQPEPVHLVAPPVAGDCGANPGTFCGSTTESGGHWRNFADWGAVGYQKDAAGYVHLQGGAAFGGEGNTVDQMFYLPPGFRPAAKTQIATTECDGTAISVLIGTDGSIDPDPVNFLCVVLDGISFHP